MLFCNLNTWQIPRDYKVKQHVILVILSHRHAAALSCFNYIVLSNVKILKGQQCTLILNFNWIYLGKAWILCLVSRILVLGIHSSFLSFVDNLTEPCQCETAILQIGAKWWCHNFFFLGLFWKMDMNINVDDY